MEFPIYPLAGKYSATNIKTSIIIPLYKSSQVIVEQIQNWHDNSDDLEIVYIDDKCPEGSTSVVFQEWTKRKDLKNPVVKLIQSSVNRGFGGACNLGAYFSYGQNLVFLNSDVVTTKGWLEPLVEVLHDQSVGVVGNLQLTPEGLVDSVGSEWSWEHMRFLHVGKHIHKGEILDEPLKECPPDLLELQEREMVTGCCFAIRKSLFEQIGGFDHHYKCGYWEDSHMNMVVKFLGYKVMVQPKSVVFHKGGQSQPRKSVYEDLNKQYFTNKWVDTLDIDGLVNTKRPSKPARIENILVKRADANGDVLMATAVLPSLRAKFPDSKIYFCTNCPEVLKGNPDVDFVIKEYAIRNTKFQLTYDLNLSYERRPKINILDAYLQECAVPRADQKPYLATEPYELPFKEKYVVVHAGKTAWAGRNWSVGGFNIVAYHLHQEGFKIVCVGSKGDAFVYYDADLRGKTNIQELAGVIKGATLFVGIDSFPMHIAQTLNVPGVCFFGSVLPETRLINNAITPMIQRGLSCIGCHNHKSWMSTVTSECKTGTLDCENLVTGDMMWRKVKSCLERLKAK